MQLQKVIEQLGYSANEARVYLALLSLGESHVTDVAAKTKMPRSSTQVILETLHKDGLVNFYERRRYKYWLAENPSKLLARLESRKNTIQAVLPQLEALRHGESGTPRVKVFTGVDEIRLIYEDMLETKQHIQGVIPWEDWILLLGRGFMEDFIERRIRHYLRMRLLIPKSPVAISLHARDSKELRETRFLPEHMHVNTTTLLYGPKVAIVSLNKKLPTAVLIEDHDVSATVNAFFDNLWDQTTL